MSELPEAGRHTSDVAARRLRRRHAAERRFRLYGAAAIGLALLALVTLLSGIAARGVYAFEQHVVTLAIDFDPQRIGIGTERDEDSLRRANYAALVHDRLRALFPDVEGRRKLRGLYAIVSSGAGFALQQLALDDPAVIGTTRKVELPLSDEADQLLKGQIRRDIDESARTLSDAQIGWIDALVARGRVERIFNWRFLTNGDSREPELAGLRGALLGSFWTLLVTLSLCFPIGVSAAIYLEGFAPRNRLTDFIEVNINNLAAVPSIVFGLLGLAVFLNVMGLPRSAPLVGGLVLALMTLPTIILASRAALASVPPSIHEAALGVGASPMQTMLHHVLPLALPGILTGTIIGMARALGETAPLLMIGMVAFIADVPSGPLAPATALPIQVYLWADSPERAFVEKTAGAILVLLGVLIVMNLAAIVLRNRYERRW